MAFQIADIKGFNYLDWDSLFVFYKKEALKQKSALPTKKRINGIFRRLDLNADCKIAFNEFAEAVKPVDIYSS